MKKAELWLLLASRPDRRVCALAPTLAWLARERGAEFEMYLEAHRTGQLFAQTGSTVRGGDHFQQFNYLHQLYAVRPILLGEAALFASSLRAFGDEPLARGDNVGEIYQALGLPEQTKACLVDDSPPAAGEPDFAPYAYAEIYFGRYVGLPRSESAVSPWPIAATVFMNEAAAVALSAQAGASEAVCPVRPGEGYAGPLRALAERWAEPAGGVAFGDPDAILSMLATLCRERRPALYAPAAPLVAAQIECAGYTEARSPLWADVCDLAARSGNPVIVGRQTGDGDLFAWSSRGVAIEIMDPNRPAFPVVKTQPLTWANQTRTVYDLEPDDAQLEKWRGEGRILASLLVHSGEMAHNEAMLNLIELCAITGLKLGLGVQTARYTTCPQHWELLSVPVESGGALGLIEPVLHCGGRGVLVESACPPAELERHARQARTQIAEVCGPAWTPRGHLCFLDSDLASFTQVRPDIFRALENAGLEYTVSCARPGRNRVLYETPGHLALNQTNRTICTGSPYVRVNTVDDCTAKTPFVSPGWFLGVIDAPVVAFNPHIWRQGHEFMRLVDWLLGGSIINVTPRTVARYARRLAAQGQLPPVSAS